MIKKVLRRDYVIDCLEMLENWLSYLNFIHLINSFFNQIRSKVIQARLKAERKMLINR